MAGKSYCGVEKMTRILLMRHGLTDYNVANKIQGSIQTKLLAHGLLQARDLGKRLSDEKIDSLYSSSMERAIMTAKEIQKYHPHLKLITFDELAERDFGVFEGLHYKDAKRQEPRLLARENYTDFEFMPKEGESWRHVQNRSMKIIRKLIKKHPNDTIGIVAHGGTNRIILNSLIGLPLSRLPMFKQNNACVNIIDISGRKVRVVLINDTGHTISQY
jgi:broad specificity phosphatase PhoE